MQPKSIVVDEIEVFTQAVPVPDKSVFHNERLLSDAERNSLKKPSSFCVFFELFFESNGLSILAIEFEPLKKQKSVTRRISYIGQYRTRAAVKIMMQNRGGN
jgi:hypothetical protein